MKIFIPMVSPMLGTVIAKIFACAFGTRILYFFFQVNEMIAIQIYLSLIIISPLEDVQVPSLPHIKLKSMATPLKTGIHIGYVLSVHTSYIIVC